MSIQKAVIIIPTYNEEAVIARTVYEVFAATSSCTDFEIHVLVFDSASTDRTQNIVLGLQKNYSTLHLLTEPAKSGLGSAYLQAMSYALTQMSAEVIMEFDADLSHQPKYILPMLEALKHSDVVIGSRYVQGGCIPDDWGWYRTLLSRMGNFIARAVLTRKYQDFTSGFRATRQSALTRALPKEFLSSHYAYKIQLLWSLHRNNSKIVEFPIVFVDREKGKSKLPMNSIYDALRVLFLLRFFEVKLANR